MALSAESPNDDLARWKHEVAKSPTREQPPTTVSGVPIKPLYMPDDLAAFDHETDLGYPGQYPFTRGVHASMYRGRLWTMRQFASRNPDTQQLLDPEIQPKSRQPKSRHCSIDWPLFWQSTTL